MTGLGFFWLVVTEADGAAMTGAAAGAELGEAGFAGFTVV